MAWKSFGNSSLQGQEWWDEDEDYEEEEEEEEELERAGTALISSNLLVTSCSSNSSILLTGDAREGEVRLLDGRSAAGGVNGRSDDSKPRGRVSSWVSDGTGVALVALTGRIGLMETTCIQCNLLAVGDSGFLSISVMT
jgi:hypothetical protein